MAEQTTHAIVTNEGEYGFSLTSPQLPGLVYARATQAEFMADFEATLRREGVQGEVQGHHQLRGESFSGAEYVVRWAEGPDEALRKEAGSRMIRALSDPVQEAEFVANRDTDAAGVHNFVCCLATDTLGWVFEQMDPRGDLLIMLAAVGDRMLFALEVARGPQRPGWPTIDEAGWDDSTTIGEVMAAEMAPKKLAYA